MISFELATFSDLENIVATYNSTIESRMVTADLEPVSVESKISWFNQHNAVTRPLWIVKQDNLYLGWMSFNSFYGRPAYEGCVEVSIYLNNEAKGKGIGKQCLNKAILCAKEIKSHTLLGFIFAHNTPSLNLFNQFGFKEWANLPAIANMDGIMKDLKIVGLKIE